MPPAKNGTGVGRLRFAGCVFCLVGRAFNLRPKSRRCAAVGLRNAPAGAAPAEPIKVLKFFNVRRGQGPALQTGANGRIAHKPRAGHTPAGRQLCLPYKHPVLRTQAGGRPAAVPFYGPHACGPCEPAGNGRGMGKAGVCRRPARLRTRAGVQNCAPSVAAITALMVCMRFSASRKTMDCAPANTSSVTSISLRPNFSPIALPMAVLWSW